MKRVLVTAGRFPSGLHMIRNLHKAGLHVVVAENLRPSICEYSKARSAFYYVPHPILEEVSFIRDILRIVEKEEIDTIIPVFEEGFVLSQNRQRFPATCHIFFPEITLATKAHDKYAFTELCRDLGLSVPETYKISSKDIAAAGQFGRGGFVLKPVFSRGGSQTRYYDDSSSHCFDLDHDREYIAQQWIRGQHFCSFGIAHKGQLSLSVVYEPALTLGHVAISFRGVHHPEINSWVKTFCSETNYEGFVSFDFIQDSSGKLYAIECNPRMTSGVHVCDPAAFNRALIYRLKASDPLAVQQYAVKVGLVDRMLQNLRNASEFDKTLKQFLKTRDVMMSFGDPLPALAQFYCYFMIMRANRNSNRSLVDLVNNRCEWQPSRELSQGLNATGIST
jgi:predicted ATP-grasp superfamily ATP-dependent carboligase